MATQYHTNVEIDGPRVRCAEAPGVPNHREAGEIEIPVVVEAYLFLRSSIVYLKGGDDGVDIDFWGAQGPRASGEHLLRVIEDPDGEFAVAIERAHSALPVDLLVLRIVNLRNGDHFEPCAALVEQLGGLQHLYGRRFRMEFVRVSPEYDE